MTFGDLWWHLETTGDIRRYLVTSAPHNVCWSHLHQLHWRQWCHNGGSARQPIRRPGVYVCLSVCVYLCDVTAGVYLPMGAPLWRATGRGSEDAIASQESWSFKTLNNEEQGHSSCDVSVQFSAHTVNLTLRYSVNGEAVNKLPPALVTAGRRLFSVVCWPLTLWYDIATLTIDSDDGLMTTDYRLPMTGWGPLTIDSRWRADDHWLSTLDDGLMTTDYRLLMTIRWWTADI